VADLLLICRADHPTYEDGDILCAMSERRILQCHTEHACHVKDAPRARSGHCVRGSRHEDLEAARYSHRIERDGRDFIRYIRQSDEHEWIIGSTPVNVDGRLMHMHVEEYFARRLRHPRNRIFGAVGNEVCYGGRQDLSPTKLDTLWTRIEAETQLRKVDHQRWPFTRGERRGFLPVSFDPLTDAEAAALVEPLVDDRDPENPITLRKRAHRIDYASVYPTRTTEIRDRTQEVDLRDDSRKTTTSDVETKTRTAEEPTRVR